MDKTKNYTRPIYYRDGKELIERKRIQRKEHEKLRYLLNEKGYSLIQKGCQFFIFKNNKNNEWITQKITD